MGLIEVRVRFEIGHLDVLEGFGGWWSGDFGCLRGICCYVSVAGVWQEETFLMLPVLRTEKVIMQMLQPSIDFRHPRRFSDLFFPH